jgi:hypothetical protein
MFVVMVSMSEPGKSKARARMVSLHSVAHIPVSQHSRIFISAFNQEFSNIPTPPFAICKRREKCSQITTRERMPRIKLELACPLHGFCGAASSNARTFPRTTLSRDVSPSCSMQRNAGVKMFQVGVRLSPIYLAASMND